MDMNHSTLLLLAVSVLLWCQLSTTNSDDSAEREATLKAAVRGINTFSNSLYKELSTKPGNLVMSAFSVEAVVAMLWLGLQGDTAKQVSTAMHLPEDPLQVAPGFKTLFERLQNNENVTLEIANKLYTRKEFHIKDEYQQSTEKYFQSVPEELDIINDPEGSRKVINNWASEKTHNKINDLLPKGSLTPDVIMILLNAIYFKGLWKTSFNKDNTRDELFHMSLNSNKEVPMMHLRANLQHGYLNDHDLQVLKLPYQGGKHSMLILLPNKIDGLQQLESNIENLDISAMRNNLVYKKVDVTMPRFKVLSSIDLEQPLIKLGLGVIFDSKGNFSGITDEEVYVSKAIQKAFIEVNEEGTEAAAVTALLVSVITSISLPPPPPPVPFIADHPFMYAIVDEVEGTILFMGRVMEPDV